MTSCAFRQPRLSLRALGLLGLGPVVWAIGVPLTSRLMPTPCRSVLSLACAAFLVLAAVYPAEAQFRRPAPWATGVAAAALQLSPPGEEGLRRSGSAGTAGAILGAALGTAAAFPFFLSAALEEGGCHPRGAALGCYTPMIPLTLGSALGASIGSALGKGQAAFGSTLLGSALGAAIGSAVVMSDSAPVEGTSVLFAILAPGIGAIIGNRVGQGR